MTVSCSLDDTFKFNCATYDTPDAVKLFSQIWDLFLFFRFHLHENVLPWKVCGLPHAIF